MGVRNNSIALVWNTGCQDFCPHFAFSFFLETKFSTSIIFKNQGY